MVDARSKNPAELVKYYVELIQDERRKLEEALAAISEYAAQLKRVTDDTAQRLLTRD
jgi:hypothetical protein